MKRIVIGFVLAASLLGPIAPARAHDAYDDSQAEPLRLAAFALHPIGFALEWLITRPIHFLVSQPRLEPVFGHTPHESPFGDYEPYLPEDR